MTEAPARPEADHGDEAAKPVEAARVPASARPPAAVGVGTATDESARGATPAPPSGDASLVGARLAHFEVERLLGKGGMGEVYLARDLALDRPVALKFLPREIARDERLRERFYREARAQARVQHPNVGHIYFIGEEDGQIFFAMEFIDGESLQERLDRQSTLSVGEALEYCRMAALGLGEAHQHGFTHRDVKPSNLMVDRHGTVKVLDFGIAKQTSGDAAPPALTREGAGGLVGTPLYMSPEQAKGEQVDFRSDIYSLGATLHHLVSGSPPFEGDTAMGIVAKHLADPRPRLESQRRRPAPIDELCDRMMAKRPEDRFQSYEELVDGMERASPVRNRPAGFWVRSFALSLDALLVLLVSVVLVLPLALVGFTNANPLLAIVFPAYFILCHARWGRTLGKLALEIEVCQHGVACRASLGQATVRCVGQWGLVYLAAIAHMASSWVVGHDHMLTHILEVAMLLAMLFPLADGAYTAWRSPHKRAFWDRLSGTEVRYRGR